MLTIFNTTLAAPEIYRELENSHPGYEAKWDLRFLELAMHISQWSKDPSTKVGAVIVDQKRRIVGQGYNGFARHSSDHPELYSIREEKYARVVHAEVNAILNANKSVESCTLYSTFFPCSNCAAVIIQAGITRVVSLRHSSDERYAKVFERSREMFKWADVKYLIADLEEGKWSAPQRTFI